MNLEAQLLTIRKLIQEHQKDLSSEEATKSALIMPFLRALGYDVTNPTHVTPELVADIGAKRGEKVDYGLGPKGLETIIVECKRCDIAMTPANRDRYRSQMYRYFVTKPHVRFGVLTNGIEYAFYSDVDKTHVMDDEPFYVINLLLAPTPRDIEILSLFARETFDLAAAVEKAGWLLRKSRIKAIVARQTSTPDEEFCDYLAGKVHDGRYTGKVAEYYRPMVRDAVAEVMTDRIQANREDAARETGPRAAQALQHVVDGYNIVRAIAASRIDPNRVVMRENQSYCAILLDDNARRTIIRLHFNNPDRLQLGIMADAGETRIPIAAPSEIFQHYEHILARLCGLEPSLYIPARNPLEPELPHVWVPVDYEIVSERHGLHAMARDEDDRFVVLKGSTANVRAGADHSYTADRVALEQAGKLERIQDDPEHLRFTEDVAFSSPSAAAAAVFNRSSNGREAWKVKGTEQTYAECRAQMGR